VKKDAEKEYWPRLTHEKVKNTHIQSDWSKWVDEDDEEEEGQKGISEDWDANNMNNFGGGQGGADMMGDYGAGDYGAGAGGDSDDEEEEEEETNKAEGAEKKANADLGDLDAEEETKVADK
jgi:prostaglandin-E synthase